MMCLLLGLVPNIHTDKHVFLKIGRIVYWSISVAPFMIQYDPFYSNFVKTFD